MAVTPALERTTFFVILVVTGLLFTFSWVRALRSAAGQKDSPSLRPTPYELFVGAFTNFFDTLGIGSFAVTTALYRVRSRQTVPDRQIPGTLNVGHTIPTFVEAFIFVAIVAVDFKTLIAMILAAGLGGHFGARIVSGLPRRAIQTGLGSALVLAAAFLLVKQLHLFPAGGDTLGLDGGRLVIACAANFVFGALMTLGVGLYAPCMIVVSLLGMSPIAAFPIMMGSCALLQTAASVRFVKTSAYAPRAALGLSIGGVPAVLFAAWVVKSLPLEQVRWLVFVVVLYTAGSMLRAATKKDEATL